MLELVPEGMDDAHRCCAALAAILGCTPTKVLPFSTGVIGERLPVERLVAGLPGCLSAMSDSGWAEAAHGIMTTDTLPKGSSRRVLPSKARPVTVTGIAKGAGMIRPEHGDHAGIYRHGRGVDARGPARLPGRGGE